MNNLMVRYQTPLVGLAILVLLLVAVIAVSIGNVRSQAEEQLDRVIDTIATEKKFPTQKEARSFAFFYKIPTNLPIDVADQSTSDWERIHNHDQNQTRLKVPPEGTSSPWLDANFFSEDSERYGQAITPHEATALHFLGSSGRREGLPDFRLWFAQDPSKGLYILGHLKNASPGPDTDFHLKLTIHYHPPERPVSETEFVIERYKEKTGWRLISPEKKTIRGSWWEEGQDQSFELVLQETQYLYTLELSVQRYENVPCPNPSDSEDPCQDLSYEIGTREPLPRKEARGTYAPVRYLNLMTLHYEVYRRDADGMHWLSGTPERAPDPAPTAVVCWLLTAVSRLYFYVRGIEACPASELRASSVCFLETDGVPSRIRVGGELPGDTEVIAFTEERLPVPLQEPGLVVLAAALLGLLGWLTYTDHARRRASERLEQINEALGQTTARLEQINEALGQTTARLEQINEALKSYVSVFLHQGKRLLSAVKDEASRLAETGDDASRLGHLKKIKNLVESVETRLWNSTEKFDYETVVRNEIATYGWDRFDLIDSIADTVKGFEDDGEKQIEFQNALPDGCRPSLSAAGRENTVPDNYFAEALQAPIQNALDYRFPLTPITVSLEMESGRAVLRVSNYGPTVPTDKLSHAFDLGSRYEGAIRSQTPQPASQDGHKHLGLGLFLTRQIVRAYKGTCQMENFHDSAGAGVVVTIRLPVQLKAGSMPSH